MKSDQNKRVAAFLCAVADTRSQEIDCTECLNLSGELAEARLARQALRPHLQSVVQHLSVCPECQEEFDLLERILRGGK